MVAMVKRTAGYALEAVRVTPQAPSFSARLRGGVGLSVAEPASIGIRARKEDEFLAWMEHNQMKVLSRTATVGYDFRSITLAIDGMDFRVAAQQLAIHLGDQRASEVRGARVLGHMVQLELEDAPRITEELLRRGYAEKEIRGILGENWLRVCEEVWK